MTRTRSIVILVLLITIGSSFALPPHGGSTVLASLPSTNLRALPEAFHRTRDQQVALGSPRVRSGASTVITVGPDPQASAFDPKNGEIYVVDFATNNVTAINGSTNKVLTNIGLGRSLLPATASPDNQSFALFDPANGLLYVDGAMSGNVSAINTSTNQLVAVIGPVNGACRPGTCYSGGAMALDPLTDTLYVSCHQAGCVDEINTATATIIGTSGMATQGGPIGLAYDPTNDLLYGTYASNYVIAVNAQNLGTLVARISVAPAATYIALNPDNGNLYVAEGWGPSSQNAPNATVSVINATTNKLQALVHPGGAQEGGQTASIAFASGYVLVTNENFSLTWPTPCCNLTVVDDRTDSVVTSYPLTQIYPPSALLLDPLNGEAYVSGGVGAGSCTPWPACGDKVEVVSLPGLAKLSFTASDPSPDVGQTTYLNSSVILDSPPYTWSYGGLPPGCLSQNTSSLLCVPSTPGNYSVQVSMTDQHGNTLTASLSLTVPGVTVGFTSSHPVDQLNESVFLNVSVALDASSYFAFAFTGLPAGCSSANRSSLDCTPTASGSFAVSVWVNDSLGNHLTRGLTLVVQPGPTLSLVLSRLAVDVNESLTFRSAVVGGQGPFLFAYRVSNVAVNCSSSTGPWLNCTPSTSLVGGTFDVTAEVTDTFGVSATATSSPVQVYPAMKATLAVSSATPLLAQTVAFSANGTGGRAPYTYAYSGLPYGCYSQNRSSIGCLPTQSDWYNITVLVTDRNNATANATVEMHVIFDFNVVIPASTPVGKQLTIAINTNESFNNSAFNKSAILRPDAGFGAFTYAYGGLPPGCVSANVATLTCIPTQAGTFSVTITVHDQAGDHQTHTVPVHVVAAPSSPVPQNILGLPGYDGYVAIGGAAAASLAIVVLLRKRRKVAAPPTSSREGSSKGSAKDSSEGETSKDKTDGQSGASAEPSKTTSAPTSVEV